MRYELRNLALAVATKDFTARLAFHSRKPCGRVIYSPAAARVPILQGLFPIDRLAFPRHAIAENADDRKGCRLPVAPACL